MENTIQSARDHASGDPGFDDAAEDRASGRPPSLEAQTPGLDTEQEARTLHDAKTYYERKGDGKAKGHAVHAKP